MNIVYYATEYIHGKEYIFCFNKNNLIYLGLNNVDSKIFKKITKDKILKEDKSRTKCYKNQLIEYFQGKRKYFSLNFELIGTEFQKKIWNELLSVKYGKTISYLNFSKSLGIEKSVRAVANAISQNPLLIIIPCHRIIASNGNLQGYRDGIEMKKYLIELEHKKNKNSCLL